MLNWDRVPKLSAVIFESRKPLLRSLRSHMSLAPARYSSQIETMTRKTDICLIVSSK